MNGAPFVHEVIRASAGSGKTHRLTSRYLALLAAGVEPNEILATTFTRKAAGEILDRVLERLSKAADEAVHALALAKDIGQPAAGKDRFTALLRSLLQGLHRVRIGTLDSFYIALAGSFSLELGLSAGWSICEPADHETLERDALEKLLEQQPEDIGKLFLLLSKGETNRSVQGELHGVIGGHYDSFRGSERSAWECLHVPEPVAAKEITASLEGLRGFDFSSCGHKGFLTARVDDLARFKREDWLAFIATGLAGKVAAQETRYQRKPIPPDAQALYRVLVQHARTAILRKLLEQTRATWALLDCFHRELWALKQSTGKLRFGEVTHALVDAVTQKMLRPESVSFRLDGAVQHLLLDEFQDTSLAQWRVLQPIARAITGATPPPPQSFFCVGDVKQAIYGWRGGMAAIFTTLQHSLGALQDSPLDESRRSAQPIIDVVNRVFGGLGQLPGLDKCRAGLTAWADRFPEHKTVHRELPGHVCLRSGPRQADGQGLDEQRGRHAEHVACKVKEIAGRTPKSSIGVLCRTNKTVARMIYELRKIGVDASEEGGNPLTDSPAVELVLSLFTLADHPGHSIAWFHLKNSPLKKDLEAFLTPDALARRLRCDLLTRGYGSFTRDWATALAPSCDQRDLSRLQQLVEMAYAFQPRSTLRAGELVAWARDQLVPDPSAANVRVMTIHAAKGLEFDIVILPDLDAGMLGQTPPFVVGRDPTSLAVDFVCRYAEEKIQALLTDKERSAFADHRQQCVEESLSVLYVAMTRAVHALHLFIPGDRSSRKSDAWYNLLLGTLADGKPAGENACLYEHGDPSWFKHLQAAAPPPAASDREARKPISFRARETDRRRGMEHVAPSRREGEAKVLLDRLFNPSEGTGTAAGTLYHAWFSTIGWLDEGAPTDAVLLAAAAKIRANLPAETWRDLDRLHANFRAWLENSEVKSVLQRSAYAGPQSPGFPARLKPFWAKTSAPGHVEQERRFLVADGGQFWNGSFDRVVWLVDGDRTVAADVIDFKTDAIPVGNAQALAERAEFYRPQLDAYRRAAANLAGLPEDRIATRLVFTFAGRIIEI